MHIEEGCKRTYAHQCAFGNKGETFLHIPHNSEDSRKLQGSLQILLTIPYPGFPGFFLGNILPTCLESLHLLLKS